MKFEKLSEEEIYEALKKISPTISKTYDKNFLLPRRGTLGSAGYDFYSPFDFYVLPGKTTSIPLLVKVVGMPKDIVLEIFNRSSLSLKHKITMDNAVGIIDSDYNKGIWLQITNNGDNKWLFKTGNRLCQGIFHKFEIVEDDNPISEEREGGFGSTGE